MIRVEGINHGGHRDDGEEEGGDEGRTVAEIQHADSKGAEDHGEVEPAEEGALVGEEDFGFDAGGEGDALALGMLDGS